MREYQLAQGTPPAQVYNQTMYILVGMKLNTLEKLYLCLRDERPEIVLPEDLRAAAEKPLLRMLELS